MIDYLEEHNIPQGAIPVGILTPIKRLVLFGHDYQWPTTKSWNDGAIYRGDVYSYHFYRLGRCHGEEA